MKNKSATCWEFTMRTGGLHAYPITTISKRVRTSSGRYSALDHPPWPTSAEVTDRLIYTWPSTLSCGWVDQGGEVAVREHLRKLNRLEDDSALSRSLGSASTSTGFAVEGGIEEQFTTEIAFRVLSRTKDPSNRKPGPRLPSVASAPM